MKRFLLFFIIIFSVNGFTQNLLNERIWKLPKRKKSIYFDRGVFHYDSKQKGISLKGVRNSYLSKRGYERIVFDFDSKSVPRIYGNINSINKKLYVDLFDTNLASNIKSLKNTKNISGIDFYNIDSKSLSVEVNLKSKNDFDIFILENPARLVIDIR